MDLLAVFDNKTKCGVSASTCAAYRGYANTLVRELGGDLHDILKNADKSIAWIRRSYGGSDASKKNMMAAVLAIFKHNRGLASGELADAHEKWKAAYEEVKGRIDDRYKTNEPSEKQHKGYVRFERIKEVRDGLPKGSAERLLLSMYSMIRPLRGDFNKVRIYTGRIPAKPEDNYIHINSRGKGGGGTGDLVLNEYKTARHNGEYRRTIPAELVDEIHASLEKRPRDYLFVKADGKPYELANSYVRWANNTLQRLFDCPLTLSLIRHSYISSLDFNKLSIAEKEEIAADMAHTVQMQDKYRFIFDK